MELLKHLSGIYTTSSNFEALLTRDKEVIKSKYRYNERMSGHDVSALYGNLYFIARNNSELAWEYGYSMVDVLESAAISDNKLYLNSFEGYELNDRLTLQYLYFNSNNCTVGAVYDNKTDKYLHFIFD